MTEPDLVWSHHAGPAILTADGNCNSLNRLYLRRTKSIGNVHILFLTHRLPWAPDRGDRIRAFHLLSALSGFASVTLFSFVHDEAEERRVGEIRSAARVITVRVPRVRNLVRGALRIGTSEPVTHLLLDAPDVQLSLANLVMGDRPDVVLAYCSGMARFAMAPPLSELPFVLDMVDVDSEKWRLLAGAASWPRSSIYRREARTLAAFEAAASARARAVMVVSAREREALLRFAPSANVLVVGNGVDGGAFAPPGPPAADPVVVFTGMMDYEPNVEGVLWFTRDVWPAVRAARPDARFVIVGANPTWAVRALGADRSIEVTGRVDQVAPHLWRAAVSVAPLHTARGLQNKVLEALAAGLPAVATTPVARGLPAGVERGCAVADDAMVFAHEVLTLLDLAPEARRAKAAAAGVEALTWERQLAPVREILENAAART